PPAVTQAAAAASPAPPPGPAPEVPKPSAPERTAVAPATGAVEVQLAGPVPSKSAAQVKSDRLARAFPGELGQREPILAQVEEHGRTVWRVRARGFTDDSAASSFCEQVRTTGTSCKVIE